jgi:hypothetical protein
MHNLNEYFIFSFLLALPPALMVKEPLVRRLCFCPGARPTTNERRFVDSNGSLDNAGQSLREHVPSHKTIWSSYQLKRTWRDNNPESS